MAEVKKKWWQQIPLPRFIADALSAFGFWGWVATAFGVALSAALAAWAWFESKVPYWAMALIFLGVMICGLAAAYYIQGIILKRKQSRAIDKLVTIDREELAGKLEEMAQKIAALVGEYRGPMQEEWWKDAMIRDPSAIRTGMARIEGKLIEKYSDKYAANVWGLVRRASKVIQFDRGLLWHIQRGVRHENDLAELYTVLAQIADDIRYPAPPLPETDRRREELLGRKPEIPSGTT